jgi:hypothetical protein
MDGERQGGNAPTSCKHEVVLREAPNGRFVSWPLTPRVWSGHGGNKTAFSSSLYWLLACDGTKRLTCTGVTLIWSTTSSGSRGRRARRGRGQSRSRRSWPRSFGSIGRSSFQGDDEHVFVHPERGSRVRPDRYAEGFRKTLKRAGITQYVRPFHDARHSSLTLGAATGENSVVLMTRAGHSNMATTKQYLHLAGTVFPEDAQRLENRLLETEVSTESSTGIGCNEREALVVKTLLIALFGWFGRALLGVSSSSSARRLERGFV